MYVVDERYEFTVTRGHLEHCISTLGIWVSKKGAVLRISTPSCLPALSLSTSSMLAVVHSVERTRWSDDVWVRSRSRSFAGVVVGYFGKRLGWPCYLQWREGCCRSASLVASGSF